MKQKNAAKFLKMAMLALLVFVFAATFVACGNNKSSKTSNNSGKANPALSMSEEFLDIYIGFVLKNTLEEGTDACVYVRYYPTGDPEEMGVGGSKIVAAFHTQETTCEVYTFEKEGAAENFVKDTYSFLDEDDELSVSILGGRTVTVCYGTKDYSAPKDVNFYQNEILTAKIPKNSISEERLDFIKKAMTEIDEDTYISLEFYKSNKYFEHSNSKAPDTYEAFYFASNNRKENKIDRLVYTNSDGDIDGAYSKKELSEIAQKIDTDYGRGSYVDTTRESGFVFAELYAM